MDEEVKETFSMPRELEGRRPRRVRRKAGSLGCGIVFGRLFILPHTLIGLFLLFMVPVTIAMMFFGQVHEGRVVTKWMTSGKKKINYHIRYSYDAGGEHRSGERSCSKSEYDAIAEPAPSRPPQSIEIRSVGLMGHHFHEAILPGESQWGKIGGTAAIALFWNGFLSIFVYFLWIAPWQEKRLCRWGTPVPGRIFGKHTRSGKSTSYYLDYEFIQPQIGICRKKQSVTSERYYQAREGELVTVLCYPQRTWGAVIYEYGDFECG
jgi:hypothetical protein